MNWQKELLNDLGIALNNREKFRALMNLKLRSSLAKIMMIPITKILTNILSFF
jgi:hypothetical protein